MIGIRFALFSKDSDDLSVTISMEENYQKLGAKCSFGGNLEKNNESALKDWKWPLKHESQQKNSGGRKSELEAADNSSSFKNHYLNHQAMVSIL